MTFSIRINAHEARKQMQECEKAILDLLPADCEKVVQNRICLGLQELLQNSYEHGTLGISFEEKRQALSEDSFDSLCAGRATQQPYAEREIRVEASVESGMLMVSIADEGPGFDWREFKRKAPSVEDLSQLHGRGVYIAYNVFDTVEYNESGNEVRLTKRLQGSPST